MLFYIDKGVFNFEIMLFTKPVCKKPTRNI